MRGCRRRSGDKNSNGNADPDQIEFLDEALLLGVGKEVGPRADDSQLGTKMIL